MTSEKSILEEIVDKYCKEISPKYSLPEETLNEILEKGKMLLIDPKIFIYPYFPLQSLKVNDVSDYISLYSKINKYFLLFETAVFWSLEKAEFYYIQGIDDMWAFLSPLYKESYKESIRDSIRDKILISIYDAIERKLKKKNISDSLKLVVESINKNYWENIKYPIPPKYLIKQDLVWKLDIKEESNISQPIIFAYPKSFFFKIWAISISPAHYIQMPKQLFDEWLDLFEEYFIQERPCYDDIVKEILIPLFSSHSDWVNKLKERLTKLLRVRSIDSQVSLVGLIDALEIVEEEKRIKNEIDPFLDEILIEGTPLWERNKMRTKEPSKKRDECWDLNHLFSTNFFSSDNYDVFLGERVNRIREMGERFCMYEYRKTENPDDEAKLIALWINQFKRFALRDVVWKLLCNLKYYTTEEIKKIYKNYLTTYFNVEDIRGKKVLFLGEAGATSGILVTTFIKGLSSEYGGISEDEIRLLVKLEENEFDINLLNKLREGDFSDIVYLEDIIGSGTQARKNLNVLLNHLEKVGVNNVKIHYWYVCASSKSIVENIKKSYPTTVHIPDGYTLEKHNLKYVLDEYYLDPKEREEIKKILSKICKDLLTKNNPVSWAEKFPLGFGGEEGGELLVVFELNCPNNTIPIFWRDGFCDGEDFFALFPRGKLKEGDINNSRWENFKDIFEKFKRLIYP
jgi:hypothetical protein